MRRSWSPSPRPPRHRPPTPSAAAPSAVRATANTDASISLRHAPSPRVESRRIVDIALCRIAVYKRPHVDGMLHAAHFVLDREEDFPAVGIDNVLETVLMLVTLFTD